jgi:hypothetical protein
MENSIFKILLDSQKASQIALDQQGRFPYPTLAVVVQNQDPDNLRRIKVALPSNPALESDWMMRLQTHPFIDPPLPDIGQTVLIFYVDGLETQGVYLQLVNNTNPARDKIDPIKDLSEEIPGHKDSIVKQDNSLTVEGKITTNAGDIETSSNQNIKYQAEEDFQVEVKRNIFMDALQAITLQAAQYVMLKAGVWFIKIFSNGVTQMGGGVLTIDCGGYGISFENVGTLSINGSPIATVGATDTDGDTIVNKGW